MPDQSGEASPEFLDEFYAECDEHLTALRRALARLEETNGQAVENEEWEFLLREMHSLKGILGMAGLEGPERLAHATEDFLRPLSKQETALDEQHLDALALVTETLEHALAAHRQKHALPNVAPVLERISRLAQSPAKQPLQPPSSPKPAGAVDAKAQARLRHAREAGQQIWRFQFSPSAELNQRGININEVRARLQSLGEILHSAPHVEPTGAIVFEFLLATNHEPAFLARWKDDGLIPEPVEDVPPEPAQPASAAPPESRESAPLPDLSAPAYVAPSHFVRVDLSRLDELMQAMGEMVVHRARLEDTLDRVSNLLPEADSRALQEINYAFARELRRLRNGLMRVRLVPLADIFERMSLVVRDMVRESGRKIRLTLRGQETQIDKYIVERLKDPLLHLVRNAVAHGLEPESERAARGKPEALTIALRASTVGESVLLEVEDDGRGLDEHKLLERAAQAGLPLPETLTPAAMLELLCVPGFSTKEQADLGAGRGVGMAVVKNTVTELGGELSLKTEPGRGTTFTLRLPLTLAIADALLITVGEQRFALPQTGLQEITTVSPQAIQRLEKTEFMRYREGILPLVHLARLFHLPTRTQLEYPVMVIGHGVDQLGVVAERVLGQREIMVRALSDPLLKNPAVSGATELGDGRAVLILDAFGLIQTARLAA